MEVSGESQANGDRLEALSSQLTPTPEHLLETLTVLVHGLQKVEVIAE